MFVALAFSLIAHAASLPSLSLDLDADGRADTVRVLEGAQGSSFQVLEVALTASGQKLRFDKLISRTFDETPEKMRNENSHCFSLLKRKIEASTTGTFLLKEFGGSYDACAGEWQRSLEVRLVGSKLVVTKLTAATRSWSMGDPSPTLSLTFDFASGALSGIASDHRSRGDKPEKGYVVLKCGVQPLASFQQEHFSTCAKAAARNLSKVMTVDCGRAYDTISCPLAFE
jgi:hypothetical protein